jgi:hypothetical protein
VSLGNTLTASKAFVALALFQILRFPLTMLASLLTNVIQVGNTRIFLVNVVERVFPVLWGGGVIGS